MLLVDTGVFLSAADRSEPRHLSCSALPIATLNARDFTVVRPDHCDAFELLP